MGFNGTTLTPTRSNGLLQDATAPSLGSLSMKAMNQPGALAGPKPGSDTKLIHNGDLSELIDKNRNVRITLDDNLEVHQKQTEDIYQEAKLTYHEEATLTHMNKRHLITYVEDWSEIHGDRKVDVDGHDDETYAVHREVHEPVNFEFKGLEMGSKGLSIDLKGTSLETTALTVGVEGLKVVSGVFTESNELIEDQLRCFFGLTKGLDLRVGLLALRLDPRVNGGPTVSTSAPFGA